MCECLCCKLASQCLFYCVMFNGQVDAKRCQLDILPCVHERVINYQVSIYCSVQFLLLTDKIIVIYWKVMLCM